MVVHAKKAAGGIDGWTIRHFEKQLDDNLSKLQHQLLSGTWNPEPYRQVEIIKNASEKRKLGLLSIKDKIVQQAIKTAIEPRMDKLFLNVSYGYRPGKGPERAIRRAVHDMQKLKNGYTAKLDIDNYFDSIDQERLFSRLGNWLQDNDTLRIIRLCMQTGFVTSQMKWHTCKQGIPQGAILSPLLANFYLHPFDQFATGKVPVYLRYADDFLIAASSKSQLEAYIALLREQLLSAFSLQLNAPEISSVHDGIEFPGVVVSGRQVTVTAKKMNSLKEKIQSVDFICSFLSAESISTLQGIRNYYGHLLPDELLKELDCELINRLNALIKRKHATILNKKELAANLQRLDFFSSDSNRNKKQLIQQLCSTYLVYAAARTNKPLAKKRNEQLITQKKHEYRKKENEGAELVVSTPGSYIGASHKGITVKVNGKAINKPSPALRHITVTGKGACISSNALMFCMTRQIPIDFFDGKGKQYATVLNPVFLDAALWNKQSRLPTPFKVKLAALIILGKLKNQQNLIKYYHKYHKDVREKELAEKYVETILKTDRLIEETKRYACPDENYAPGLMAIESQAAIAYWAYIRLLIADDGIDFIRREHQGATDLFNSLLNYGYAILYARVWKTLLSARLNPSIGVLHAQQDGKPALVFDVVELFRAQMVDRVVISLVQKKISLKMHNGLLNESTKRILIRHILERLNRYEKFRGEEITFSQIILKQSQEIARFIAGESETFKPYVAKW